MSYNQEWRHACGHRATAITPFANIVDNIESTNPHPALIIPSPCPMCPHFEVGEGQSFWSSVSGEVETIVFDADDISSTTGDAESYVKDRDSVIVENGSEQEGEGDFIMDDYRGSTEKVFERVMEDEDVSPPSANGNNNPFSGAEQFGVDCDFTPVIPSESCVDGRYVYRVPMLVAGGRARMFVGLSQAFEGGVWG